MNSIVFVKLGGSLITDKTKPLRLRAQVIRHLSQQIRDALRKDPSIRLILGNGAGSFGHYFAHKHKMVGKIESEKQKMGFCQVQTAVSKLNRIVVEELLKAGVKACSIHPSSIIISTNGRVKELFLESLLGMLKLGVTPVLYGDIVYDEILGSSILSTEKVFKELILKLKKEHITVDKVIHCSSMNGVIDKQGRVIPHISKSEFKALKNIFLQVTGTDVTGGMFHKVEESLKLAMLGVKSIIINGASPGNLLTKVLLDKPVEGTIIG